MTTRLATLKATAIGGMFTLLRLMRSSLALLEAFVLVFVGARFTIAVSAIGCPVAGLTGIPGKRVAGKTPLAELCVGKAPELFVRSRSGIVIGAGGRPRPYALSE